MTNLGELLIAHNLLNYVWRFLWEKMTISLLYFGREGSTMHKGHSDTVPDYQSIMWLTIINIPIETDCMVNETIRKVILIFQEGIQEFSRSLGRDKPRFFLTPCPLSNPLPLPISLSFFMLECVSPSDRGIWALMRRWMNQLEDWALKAVKEMDNTCIW